MDTLIVIGCLKFQSTTKIFYTLLTKVYTSETLTTYKKTLKNTMGFLVPW